MKIVVDTNILFSILIKPAGTISGLFNALYISNSFFIAERTLAELQNHHQKLIKLSRLTETEILSLKQDLINRTQIIEAKNLRPPIINIAYDLVKDIDVDDAAFVATTIYLDAILWSGDKSLIKGLKTKGFHNIYDSAAIQTLLL
ncbi:PIN domain-containing protein [Parasediminibacterium sp. JCM 36343]|uniref:PIN domain-containing protein n=1 Tax=Parasediminibacterium sp. JCM 36343 TaxID=3374279 RepID=UPI00397CAE24